jgi:nicotinate-nucleotide--dimethylbenzimidazole phosphoribosyltransferase
MRIPTLSSPYDHAWAAALDAEIDTKTKPQGSLGVLESLAKRIGLIQQTIKPCITDPTILVFAGDHGVTAENISAYPQSVTWQMVENFLAGGAAINVFARQSGCALKIVDAGVNHDFGVRDNLLDRKIGLGTKNFAVEPAMSHKQCASAIDLGMNLIDDLAGNVVGFGEMGIGNTTAAAAIMHMLTAIPIIDCVGAGTGLSSEGIAHKKKVIEDAVKHHSALQENFENSDAIKVLSTFGGFEIAMMTGAMLRAAERRMVLLIDGFIATSALIVAAKLQPSILEYCVFCHCSDEHGHRLMLDYLDVRPLLQLNLRLGEGTGCALALPLAEAAVRFLGEMATFSSADVSNKADSKARDVS